VSLIGVRPLLIRTFAMSQLMHAAVVERFGQPLALKEVAIP